MKLIVTTALAAALALTACNRAGESESATSAGKGSQSTALDSVFPNLMQASYREEITITENAETRHMVLIRAGKKMRVEVMHDGGVSTIVTNLDSNEHFTLTEANGQRIAMRLPLDSAQISDAMKDWSAEGRAMTRVGACSAAGVGGTEWSIAPTETDSKTRTSCVTSDGILLKATENGATTWEATSVQRGAQDPALFTIPQGYQVLDLGPMGAQMREAADRMKAQQNR